MENLEELREVKVWLRELREQRGYTQLEVAEMVGADERTIMNAENQKHSLPRGITMLRWLRALGVVAEAPVELGIDGPARRDELRVLIAESLEELTEAVRTNTRELHGLRHELGRGSRRSGP